MAKMYINYNIWFDMYYKLVGMYLDILSCLFRCLKWYYIYIYFATLRIRLIKAEVIFALEMHPNRFIIYLLIAFDLLQGIGFGHIFQFPTLKGIIAVLFITNIVLDFCGTFIIYSNNGIHCSNYYALCSKRGGAN